MLSNKHSKFFCGVKIGIFQQSRALFHWMGLCFVTIAFLTRLRETIGKLTMDSCCDL